MCGQNSVDNMENKIKKYMESLSDEDKLLYARKQVNTVLSSLKSRNKASMAEFNTASERKGVRGGRRTTLSANSYNTARIYDSNLEDLKTLIKYL